MLKNKRSLKISIILAIVVLAICVLNISTVQATDYSNLIATFPDKITVNISKETVEQKVNELIIVPTECEIDTGVVNYSYPSQIRVQLRMKGYPNSDLGSKYISIRYTSDLLEVIPNEIKLDIPEVECKKAPQLVEEKIRKIWKDNNLTTEGIDNIFFWASLLYGDIDSFYEAGINLNMAINLNKTISIKYNNTDKKNTTDEQYVKNLKIESPKYYEVDLDFLAINDNEWENKHKEHFDLIEEYYTNLIKDNSIVVKAQAGAGGTDGGINLWTWESGTGIGIFKNGLLYDLRRMGNECTVPVINVPSTVDESDLNNYITTQITKYYKEFGENITRIEKGTASLGVDIPNGYTIYADNYADGNATSYIKIKKQKPVNAINTETNIKLETNNFVVPENTKLISTEIKETETIKEIAVVLEDTTDKFVAYNISLESDNVKIQPNGKVKISLPIPEGYDTSKLVIYRVAEDGTKTKYDVKVETIEGKKYATFETDHFSTYVLAEKATTTEIVNNTIEMTRNNKELDETPKTGTRGVIKIISLVALNSIIGIAILNVKKK